MNIQILSIKELKHYLRSGLISSASCNIIISTSYPENLLFLKNYKIKNLLILNYDDISNNKINAFNIIHAKQIKDFLKICKNENLIICCDAGISRSPAIASAILKYYNFNENIILQNKKYTPNLYIFNLLYDFLEK